MAARVRGKKDGRKKILETDLKILTARKMHRSHKMDISDICNILQISRATCYRYLALHLAQIMFYN